MRLRSTLSYPQRLIYGRLKMPQSRQPLVMTGLSCRPGSQQIRTCRATAAGTYLRLMRSCTGIAHVGGEAVYGQGKCDCDILGANCAIYPLFQDL